MEVRELSRTPGDLMDVEVERPRRRRMKLHLEPGLLVRLAHRRGFERDIARLEMAPRLQQPPELRVLDEAGANARFVDHEGGCGEMRAGLVPRQRLRELLREPEHGAAVRLLARVAGDIRLQHPHEGLAVAHSYWSASRTFSRAARRAGKIAARIPTTIVISAKMISEKTGSEN